MEYAKKDNKKPIWENQPDFRKEILETLFGFLQNPGRFSILLLGARGTGKLYWLGEIVKHYNDKDCLSDIIAVNGLIAKDTDENFWEQKFAEANNKLLIVDEVEELSKRTQAILFECLSTNNGKYGWKEKRHECRIVFTSTNEITTLRDSENVLLNKFFDRISQLVVAFPSFSEKNISIWDDFKATWSKMIFPKDKLPKKDLEDWLKTHSHKFHGNFRDLDKIAINWRNYQLAGVNEKEILGKVSKDFFSLYHFPEHKSENKNAFYIKENLDFYNEIQPMFLKFVKEFAKAKYGKLSKAPEGKPLGVPYRTMERW